VAVIREQVHQLDAIGAVFLAPWLALAVIAALLVLVYATVFLRSSARAAESSFQKQALSRSRSEGDPALVIAEAVLARGQAH
jgi:hypothetical protein